VFRGLAVALMIVVNNPGSWAHIHPPFRHAAWNGLTFADLVFPFFLFIVGVAVSLSFARRVSEGATRGDLVRKIIYRSLIIFALGLFLNGFPFNIPLNASMAHDFYPARILESLADLRIPGVLQRIALCYLMTGLTVVLIGSNRNRALAAAGFLVLYELLMRLPLVAGWGAGSFDLQDNFVRWADLHLLGAAHLYRVGDVPFDPEGLVSTLPAAATTMAGFFAGEFLRGAQPLTTKLKRLALVGSGLALAGFSACWIEPVNKQLWTVSYVLVTGGMALITLAISSWMIDVRRWRVGTFPPVVFGSNPLVAFVGSGLLARMLILVQTTDSQGKAASLKHGLYDGFFSPLVGPLNGSLSYAVATVIFWFLVLWVMYRLRLFIKI
jgi:predicted acyltransferase